MPDPLVFKVTFGAFTVSLGMEAPTGNVTVLVAEPDMKSVALPPSNAGPRVTFPCPSTVPVPPLLLISPSVKVNEPAAVRVLVLLNSKEFPLDLLIIMLFNQVMKKC